MAQSYFNLRFPGSYPVPNLDNHNFGQHGFTIINHTHLEMTDSELQMLLDFAKTQEYGEVLDEDDKRLATNVFVIPCIGKKTISWTITPDHAQSC